MVLVVLRYIWIRDFKSNFLFDLILMEDFIKIINFDFFNNDFEILKWYHTHHFPRLTEGGL